MIRARECVYEQAHLLIERSMRLGYQVSIEVPMLCS
jgi:hypothetical protein